MSRGGYRPGTGRPKGAKDSKPRKGSKSTKKAPGKSDKTKIKELLSLGTKAKARMYQEFLLRISKNEKLSIAEKRLMDNIGAELESEMKEDEKPDLDKKDIDASEFLRGVWNDASVEIALRIRAAEIVFRNDGEKKGKGKKEVDADKAKQAGAGRFQSGKPPLALVKSNG
jgi:hypothetical protein